MAHALEILQACKVPRWNIKLFRTDAIILSSRAKVAKKAKEALVAFRRESLNAPSNWLTFNGSTLLEGGKGEGQVFRVFNCECTLQNKPGILFEPKSRIVTLHTTIRSPAWGRANHHVKAKIHFVRAKRRQREARDPESMERSRDPSAMRKRERETRDEGRDVPAYRPPASR